MALKLLRLVWKVLKKRHFSFDILAIGSVILPAIGVILHYTLNFDILMGIGAVILRIGCVHTEFYCQSCISIKKRWIG